jgi:hypothetical protein
MATVPNGVAGRRAHATILRERSRRGRFAGDLLDALRLPVDDGGFEVSARLRADPVAGRLVDVAARVLSLVRRACRVGEAFVSRTTLSPSKSEARRMLPSSTRIVSAPIGTHCETRLQDDVLTGLPAQKHVGVVCLSHLGQESGAVFRREDDDDCLSDPRTNGR